MGQCCPLLQQACESAVSAVWTPRSSQPGSDQAEDQDRAETPLNVGTASQRHSCRHELSRSAAGTLLAGHYATSANAVNRRQSFFGKGYENRWRSISLPRSISVPGKQEPSRDMMLCRSSRAKRRIHAQPAAGFRARTKALPNLPSTSAATASTSIPLSDR